MRSVFEGAKLLKFDIDFLSGEPSQLVSFSSKLVEEKYKPAYTNILEILLEA